MAGFDPLRLLRSEDQVEMIVVQAATRHYFELRRDLDRQLANEIANAVAKSFGG